MTSLSSGSVLITGPTGGLGRALTVQLAGRPPAERPDLLLAGRPGPGLDAIVADARRAGATAEPLAVDLGRLSEVRAVTARARSLIADRAVRPLRVVVANAGVVMADTRVASGDGYEMTFAVNYLAHAQLIGDLSGAIESPGRVVLVGSNVYRGTLGRRLMGAPAPAWRDPLELAEPAGGPEGKGYHAAMVTYATSKLALFYYAHELQRRAGTRLAVSVFEPGIMPGSGLGRSFGGAAEKVGRRLARLPGLSTPERAAPALAAVAVDDHWSHLRNGDFVVLEQETPVLPHATDPEREARLWAATQELLSRAAGAPAPDGAGH